MIPPMNNATIINVNTLFYKLASSYFMIFRKITQLLKKNRKDG